MPQSSAYLYLHRLDESFQDLILTSIVANYRKLKLSIDVLISITMIADALGLHPKPLFDTTQFYYNYQTNIRSNTSNKCTVLEQAKLSNHRLAMFIGIEESGLLKNGHGDCNDEIVVISCLSLFGIKHVLSHKLVKEYGKSIPNRL
ncbi:unnamed protein product [Rotaria sp. Silwood1]|nr:unnamed protein product [Rotaria sp. Silwood1]CAF4557721.1 unnamed protein product [Rotaria sp. Silwood1]CAF4569844.1 unnamed protein product [Rotaria sp. Silwood1]